LGVIAADDAHIQSDLAQATSVLSSLYSPSSPRYATRIQQIQNILNGLRSGAFTVNGAGIRDVSFEAVAIAGTVARVHLTFTAYSDSTVHMSNGQVMRNTPSNKMIGDLSLVKTDQGWRITDDVNRFAPGYEP
jgi:hypothetical protein